MPQTYEEACVLHADQQGLTPPTEVLREAGFAPNLLQTGGFVMVLSAYQDLTVQVAVTQDGPLSAPYYVCAYRPSMDASEGIPEREAYVPLSELLAVVRLFALEAPAEPGDLPASPAV